MNMKKVTIGSITLYCGDSLELLRAGVFGRIGAIVSDPPYGIGYRYGGGGQGEHSVRNMDPIHGDDEPFNPEPWVEAAPGAERILLWGSDHFRRRLPEGGTMLAWDKHLGRGADDSFTDCEWAWCGRKVKREVFRYLWKGITRQSVALDGAKRLHVSQKPVELMRWCIDKVRPLSGLPVLDPYMGSGSTLIAAMTLGLPAIGCEIDPAIFELAVERVRMAQKSWWFPELQFICAQ